MSASMDITCPKCSKIFKVPAEYAGKTAQCRNCQNRFRIPDGPSASPPNSPAATAKPVTAKAVPATAKAVPAKAVPAKAVAVKATKAEEPQKVVAKKVEEKPKDDAPIAFKDDDAKKNDHDDDANPYQVITEGEAPRCPFCARELDPPDARICANCGYDMFERKRHITKAVYEFTTMEYFMHWLPAIGCVVLILTLLVGDIFLWVYDVDIADFMELSKNEKNAATQQKEYFIKPWCCPMWTSLVFAYIMFVTGKFAFKRFVFDWRPEEKKINEET